MIGKTEDGDLIFSAVEIEAFVVCPEAWRLRSIEKISALESQTKADGDDLHQQWAKKYGEAVDLFWRIKLVVCLILAMLLLFMCIHDGCFG